MDVCSYVTFVAKVGRAGVDADADLKGSSFERLRPLARSLERAGCSGERVKERVALRIHLDTSVTHEGCTQESPVLCKGLRVHLRPELMQQLRRALDVGEEERDGAGR